MATKAADAFPGDVVDVVIFSEVNFFNVEVGTKMICFIQ